MNLNNVDLNKLRTFQTVVDEGGISAAARRLALTRSAVSQSVSSLENTLGIRLFNRLGRKLVLTSEGRTLSRRFHMVQEALAGTLEEIVNEESEVRGLIRLGLFLGSFRSRLASCLRALLDEHPGIRVKLRYGSQAELDAMLLDGRLDLAFSLQPSREVGKQLCSSLLYEQELVLVSHQRLGRGPVDLERLRSQDVIDYYQSSPLIRRWVRHHFGRRSAPMNVRVWAANTDLVLELVANGAGIGVVPRYLAQPLLDSRKLYLIRTGKQELHDSIWLNEPTGAHRNVSLEVFRNAIAQAFSEQ